MRVWLVHAYQGNRYLCLAISMAFDSEAAAKAWMVKFPPCPGQRYQAEAIALHNLRDVQSWSAEP